MLNQLRPISNRPLMNGIVVCVQKYSADKIVIRRPPWNEKIALILLLAGLFLIGRPLSIHHAQMTAIPPAEFAPGIVLTLLGIWFLFMQTRLVFDAKSRQIILVRPIRRAMRWSWDDFEGMEALRAWKMEDVKLVFKNGDRMTIFHTRWGRTGTMAQEIADFLHLPLERKQLT